MKRFLFVTFLLLFSLSPTTAQESRTVWNSSTGSTVELFQSGAKPVRIRLTATDKKPLDYTVAGVNQNGFTYKAGKSTIVATYTGRDEITLKNSDAMHVFRWTKRGGQAAYPVPSSESCEKTYWRNEDRSKLFLMLNTPREVSLMLNYRAGSKTVYLALPARWIEYPKRLEYKDQGGMKTIRFLNPMLCKLGSTFFFQSHPDYEDKKKSP